MSLVVQVANTTMLADLDEALRTLLTSSLEQQGFDRVDIAFDAPNREWSGQLSSPTLNVFLYDLRESPHHRRGSIDERKRSNGSFESRPPLVLECSYALTAWTKNVEDEHRLLSQALAILYAFPKLPEDVLPPRLRDGSQRNPLIARVGQARGEGKSDFWSAVGGQYKASLDYVVTLTCEPGVSWQRGPEVKSSVIRVGDLQAPAAGVVELHRMAGRIVDLEGAPEVNAWVALPDVGRFVTTDEDGKFRFDRVPPGTHKCVARSMSGDETEMQVKVPGSLDDLVVGGPKPKKRTRA